MQQHITDPDITDSDKVNSIQQGFLASATAHRLFNDYQLGVNPDVSKLTSHLRLYCLLISTSGRLPNYRFWWYGRWINPRREDLLRRRRCKVLSTFPRVIASPLSPVRARLYEGYNFDNRAPSVWSWRWPWPWWVQPWRVNMVVNRRREGTVGSGIGSASP